MTYQHIETSQPINIDIDEIERAAVDAGERLLSVACWLMITAGGIGLLFVTDKAVRSVMHTLQGCGAC
ncbi:hypothetical protein [Salipiger mangrovisoli]|uniref:Uncharacterized protein n=1 Tax=Salipiger mangrovisoli TaxID=2865933 RepID=A0ABR9WWZ7_9RHOB|nr:hypothetical protein [Salipiger mangrovisoli]MBE9635756.1 hypothetical protein [Salipiger mangrovisoli]